MKIEEMARLPQVIIIGGGFVAALFGLAAWVSAADYPEPAGLAVLVGIALLAGGLVIRRGAVVTVGLAMLGAGYGVALVGKGLDPAAGLLDPVVRALPLGAAQSVA